MRPEPCPLPDQLLLPDPGKGADWLPAGMPTEGVDTVHCIALHCARRHFPEDARRVQGLAAWVHVFLRFDCMSLCLDARVSRFCVSIHAFRVSRFAGRQYLFAFWARFGTRRAGSLRVGSCVSVSNHAVLSRSLRFKAVYPEDTWHGFGTIHCMVEHKDRDVDRIDGNREVTLTSVATRTRPTAFTYLHQMNKKMKLGEDQATVMNLDRRKRVLVAFCVCAFAFRLKSLAFWRLRFAFWGRLAVAFCVLFAFLGRLRFKIAGVLKLCVLKCALWVHIGDEPQADPAF